MKQSKAKAVLIDNWQDLLADRIIGHYWYFL